MDFALSILKKYTFIYCFGFFFFFQGELEEKVRIFERKAESYKKLRQNLESTEEYIRVMLIWHLFADHREQKDTTLEHPTETRHLPVHVCAILMQNQASEAEKQIQLEFERLHEALRTEQRLRLSELANEEEQKIAAVRKLTENINEDINDLKKLIVSVKKEMGNEDLALLQVRRDGFSSADQQRSFQRLYSVIRIALLCVSEFPGFEKKVSSLSRQHAILHILTQHTTLLSLLSLQKANIADKVTCCCLS